MNLQALTARPVGMVNPPVPCTWLRSTGYQTQDDGSQEPQYAAGVPLSGQVQMLSGKDLKAVDGLNVQGEMRSLYAQGNIQGVSDPQGRGGDMITFADNKTVPPDLRNSVWLTVQVLETWSGGWSKVAMVRQIS